MSTTKLDFIFESLHHYQVCGSETCDQSMDWEEAKQAIEAYIAEREKAARLDELAEFNRRVDEGGYLFTEGSGMYIYLADRLKALKSNEGSNE